MRHLETPYAPARAAVEQIAQDAPEAAPQIAELLGMVDANATEADALHRAIAGIVEAVCPLSFEHGRWDDPRRTRNARVKVWVETALDLVIAHLDVW